MGLDYDDGIDTDAESNPLSEAALQDQQDGNIRIDDKLTGLDQTLSPRLN